MVKCGFSRFVDGTCGQNIASSVCISLSQCARDIKPHLKGCHVRDASLKSEIQLLLARGKREMKFKFPPPPCYKHHSVSYPINIFMGNCMAIKGGVKTRK